MRWICPESLLISNFKINSVSRLLLLDWRFTGTIVGHFAGDWDGQLGTLGHVVGAGTSHGVEIIFVARGLGHVTRPAWGQGTRTRHILTRSGHVLAGSGISHGQIFAT